MHLLWLRIDCALTVAAELTVCLLWRAGLRVCEAARGERLRRCRHRQAARHLPPAALRPGARAHAAASAAAAAAAAAAPRSPPGASIATAGLAAALEAAAAAAAAPTATDAPPCNTRADAAGAIAATLAG